MEYVAPEFELDAFNCPFCKAYAQMLWERLCYGYHGSGSTTFKQSSCVKCKKDAVWLIKLTNKDSVTFEDAIIDGEMIYPDIVTIPPSSPDMPINVKAEYNEAASVLNKSPRSAAALLRQALQKLMVHLKEPGKNINIDIRSLAAKEALPRSIIKIADTMRLTGNDSVHPGEMLDEDRDHIATQMFKLLNIIVVKAITEPKEFDEFYNMTPEHKRKAAEAQDAKAKSTEK